MDGGGRDGSKALADLLQRIEQLQKSQRDQSKQEQELQGAIREGEMTCGRLLQQYLQVGNAFETKMRHVREDKERLARMQQSQESIMQELESIMKRASALVGRQ